MDDILYTWSSRNFLNFKNLKTQKLLYKNTYKHCSFIINITISYRFINEN